MKPTSQRIRSILSTAALAAVAPLAGQAADAPAKPTPPEGGEVFADHEVSHPVIGEKVANEVEIKVSLYHNDG